MQSRPLDIPKDEYQFTTPFEKIFFNAVSRSYWQYTQTPIFRAPSLDIMLDHLGFDHVPNFDRKNQDSYPLIAPYGAHPKTYLKWGVEKARHNHIILELGELYYLVHFDIKKSKNHHWHIDQIIIKDGETKYFIPCDSSEFKFLGDDLIKVIQKTVSHLNTDRNYHTILNHFKSSIRQLLDNIKSVSDEFNMDEYEQNSKMPSHRSPFTP